MAVSFGGNMQRTLVDQMVNETGGILESERSKF